MQAIENITITKRKIQNTTKFVLFVRTDLYSKFTRLAKTVLPTIIAKTKIAYPILSINSIGCKLLLFALLFSITSFSQTTLYLNTGVASPYTPAVNAAWNVTTGNTRLMMKPVKDGSTIATVQSGNTGAAAVRKILIRQWISEPLAAQTLNGTMTGQILGRISSTSSRSGQGWIYLRLIDADGTVASEIGSSSTNSYTTTLTNRTYTNITLSSVSVTAGQRLCIDVGWNYQTGTNTATNGSNSYGSNNGTDLPVNNTTTTANDPWVRFSQTLIFQHSYRGFF